MYSKDSVHPLDICLKAHCTKINHEMMNQVEMQVLLLNYQLSWQNGIELKSYQICALLNCTGVVGSHDLVQKVMHMNQVKIC